jgi:hypothetical protein
MHEFGGSLTGSGRAQLARLGRRAGVARRAERMAASRWWWERLAGARVLTALDLDCAVMRRLLRDRSATVRSQAYVWAAGRVDEAVIDELVSRLADPERLCRFTVQDSLLRLGRPAARALARFLENPAHPGLADALSVARGLAQPELLGPALALAHHDRADVRARAAAVLGVLGGDAAVETLEVQLADPCERPRPGHWETSGPGCRRRRCAGCWAIPTGWCAAKVPSRCGAWGGWGC